MPEGGPDRTGPDPVPPGPQFYGRRHGRRLRPSRAAALDALPALAVPLPPPGGQVDLDRLFGRSMADLWLEIGFGAGEHLAWQAAHHPDIGLIGCEPFVNGAASLAQAVVQDGLDNVRIHADDARTLLPTLPDASVGRCFVLFSDPWPKTRHHRRRFVQPDTLDQLARILKDGAELRLASDHPGLVDWTLFHLRRHGAFRWTARAPADWRARPGDWPPTRYEVKALHGAPVFLTFVRRERSG